MARDKSFEERRREREREDESDKAGATPETSLAQKRSGIASPTANAKAMAGDGSVEKLLELFSRVEPLIEQCNNLYNQYRAGIERRPPIERRQHLDQVMLTLQMMNKPTPAYQFRFATLQTSYTTHRDRWDRLIKDLEAGKKRIG
jgi:hypothetical protein